MIENIILILLIITMIRQILYIKDLVVKTKKEKIEVIFVAIFMIAIAIITFIFAKKSIHYLICIVGLLTFLFNWYKQGISSKGIIIVARGKELYKWNEIKNAQIEKYNSIVEIVFLQNSGSKIVTHIFCDNEYDKIINIFKENNLKYQIKKPNLN